MTLTKTRLSRVDWERVEWEQEKRRIAWARQVRVEMIRLIRLRTNNTGTLQVAHLLAGKFGAELSAFFEPEQFDPDFNNVQEAALVVWRDCYRQLAPRLKWYMWFLPWHWYFRHILSIIRKI